MKLIKKTLLIAAILVAVSSGLFAQGVISVNLISFSGEQFGTINKARFSGVVRDASWENCCLGNKQGIFVFENVDNSPMTVTVHTTANYGSSPEWNGWANRNGASASVSTDAVVLLNNIPYEKYYIIVYLGGFNPEWKAAISDGTTVKYANFMGVIARPALEECESTNKADFASGSYVVFGSKTSPLYSAERTLSLKWFGGNPTLGGFQIIEIAAQ